MSLSSSYMAGRLVSVHCRITSGACQKMYTCQRGHSHPLTWQAGWSACTDALPAGHAKRFPPAKGATLMQRCSVQAVNCKSPLPTICTVHCNMCSGVSSVWLPSAGGSARPVPGNPSWRTFWLSRPQWSWQDHHVSLLYASPVSCVLQRLPAEPGCGQ